MLCHEQRAHNIDEQQQVSMNPLQPNLPAPEPMRRANQDGEVDPFLHLQELQKRRRERKIGGQIRLLLLYIEDHDPEMLQKALHVKGKYTEHSIEMKRDLRKTIGEVHWRRYIDYYNHYRKTGERITIKPAEARSAVHPPPLPTISDALDADVTEVIFGFLDDKSIYEATKVSSSFRDALIPGQRNVTLAGFPSFEAFRRMNFLGMEYFSGEGNNLLTDSNLGIVAGDHISYPNLAVLNISHGLNVSSSGELNCHIVMGPRLDTLHGYFPF